MLDHIRSIFRDRWASTQGREAAFDEVQLAVAALLVEAACTDGKLDEEEGRIIKRLLADRFELEEEVAQQLLKEAHAAVSHSPQIYGFTRTVKDACPHEERLELIQMLWEVAYTDGELHDYEANLMRRVAGLLYISDRESGTARKQALARLGLKD